MLHVCLQYFDYSTAWITQFGILQVSDNFVEAGTASMVASLPKAIYFIVCVVMGLFLITSLLVGTFANSYENDQAVVREQPQLKKRRTLVTVVEIWTRHSDLSQMIHGADRNKLQNPAYLKYIEDNFNFDIALNLLLLQKDSAWVSALADKISQVVNLQLQFGDESAHTRDVLLDICAEMSLNDLYDRLQPHSSTESMKVRRRALRLSNRISHQQGTYEQICWLRGRSPSNAKLLEALSVLPQLLGFNNSGSTNKTSDLCAATCELVTHFYLQKWSMHRVFVQIASDNGMIDGAEIEQLVRMVDGMDLLVQSKRSRIDSTRLAIEDMLESFRDCCDSGQGEVPLEEASELLRMSQLVSHGTCTRREQVTRHKLYCMLTIPGSSSRHCDNCSRYCDNCSRHCDNCSRYCMPCADVLCGLQLDAEDAFTVHAIPDQSESMIQIDDLNHALCDGLYDWGDKQLLSDQLSHVSNTNLLKGRTAFTSEEFVEMRSNLRHTLVQNTMGEQGTRERVTYELIQQQALLQEATKPEHTSFIVCGLGELRFFFLCVSWATVFVLAMYHSVDHTDTLDVLLIILSLSPWMEVFLFACRVGFWDYITCRHTPTEVLSVFGSFVCLCVSVVGTVLLLLKPGGIDVGTSRFFCAFSTLLIFTKSDKYYDMFLSLLAVTRFAWPIVVLLVAMICIFALTAVTTSSLHVASCCVWPLCGMIFVSVWTAARYVWRECHQRMGDRSIFWQLW